MAVAPGDPRRRAGERVLDRLAGPATAAGPGAPTGASAAAAAGGDVTVRDGAALLLRRGGVLVRARPASGRATAEREVHLAATMTAAGVPVTELVDATDQPWTVDGCVVTAWRWVDATRPAGPADLGALAHALRERTAGGLGPGLPRLDPLAAIIDAVAHLEADDPEATFVRDRAADLAEPFADAATDDPLGRALVHGDLHGDNVVVAPAGPLLTDLELSGAGPSGYDAAPAALAVRRYGHDPETLATFLQAFGADPRGWSGFATYVAVYELWVTAWAVGVRGQDPSWATEATRRVATLRDGTDGRWVLR